MEKNSDLKNLILKTLDSNKALDIISIDLKNKSSMADYMIIASGTSSRHIQALSEMVLEKLKTNGVRNSKIEGKESMDWKLVDGWLRQEDVENIFQRTLDNFWFLCHDYRLNDKGEEVVKRMIMEGMMRDYEFVLSEGGECTALVKFGKA